MGGENKDNPDPMEDMLFNPAPNFINCRYGLVTEKCLQKSNQNEKCTWEMDSVWVLGNGERMHTSGVPVLFGENYEWM